MSMSHAQGELLAQVNPSVTTAQTAFTAGNLRVEITLVLVVNRNASPELVQLYHDDDGTTYNATTEIKHVDVTANADAILFQAQHPGSGIMIKPGGSLGLQVEVANDLTVSIYGITETRAERVRGIN